MADVSGVEAALVARLATLLYPGTPSGDSTAGVPVRVFRGWPVSEPLDRDLRTGTCCVSVTATGMARNITRFDDAWQSEAGTTSPVAATLTQDGNDHLVTLAGTPAADLLLGLRVLRSPYVVRILAGDTLASAASRLAAAAPGATATGPTVRLPFAFGTVARVSAPRLSWRIVRQQSEVLRVSLWCPTPAARDALGAVLDGGMADVDWLQVGSDPEPARLQWTGGASHDEAGESRVFRRDLNFNAEFATYETRMTPAVLFGRGTVDLLPPL